MRLVVCYDLRRIRDLGKEGIWRLFGEDDDTKFTEGSDRAPRMEIWYNMGTPPTRLPSFYSTNCNSYFLIVEIPSVPPKCWGCGRPVPDPGLLAAVAAMSTSFPYTVMRMCYNFSQCSQPKTNFDLHSMPRGSSTPHMAQCFRYATSNLRVARSITAILHELFVFCCTWNRSKRQDVSRRGENPIRGSEQRILETAAAFVTFDSYFRYVNTRLNREDVVQDYFSNLKMCILCSLSARSR